MAIDVAAVILVTVKIQGDVGDGVNRLLLCAFSIRHRPSCADKIEVRPCAVSYSVFRAEPALRVHQPPSLIMVVDDGDAIIAHPVIKQILKDPSTTVASFLQTLHKSFLELALLQTAIADHRAE